jgi:hypothetical protein
VFFDAAEIEWQYELQGFNVDGRNYLPDFWLPRLKIFVEIKPTIEACKAAEPLMRTLVAASKHGGLLIAGAPNSEERPEMIFVRPTLLDTKTLAQRARWIECGACNHILIDAAIADPRCLCTPTITVTKRRNRSLNDFPRVEHALEQAQWARFEHGEDGRPESYLVDDATVRVYVAGAVLDEDDDEGCPVVLPWRQQIFGTSEL